MFNTKGFSCVEFCTTFDEQVQFCGMPPSVPNPLPKFLLRGRHTELVLQPDIEGAEFWDMLLEKSLEDMLYHVIVHCAFVICEYRAFVHYMFVRQL